MECKSYSDVAHDVLAKAKGKGKGKAGGPYVGPKGGKWADPKHTIPWKPKDEGESQRHGWKSVDEHGGSRKKHGSRWYYDYPSREASKAAHEKHSRMAHAQLQKHNHQKMQGNEAEAAKHKRAHEEHKQHAEGAKAHSTGWGKLSFVEAGKETAKGFQLLAREAMAKAGASVGYPQQGVAFSGPFSPLVPSDMAGPAASPVGPDDLPDSAFLLIEEGGRRDVRGRTDPRELRKYQARDANGVFDAALLKACVKTAKAGGYGAVVRKASDILKRIGDSEA